MNSFGVCYKRSAEILSKLSGVKIIYRNLNNISCESSGCGKSYMLSQQKEKTGYVFFCECGKLYFAVGKKGDAYVLEPALLDNLNKPEKKDSVFKKFEIYYILKDILAVSSGSDEFDSVKRIAKYIEEGNEEHCQSEISDFLAAQFANFGKNLLVVKSKMAEYVLDILYSAKVPNSAYCASSDVIKNLFRAETISQISDAIELFSKALFSENEGKINYNKEEIISEVLEYMQNNFDRNITLDELSNKAFISKAYLSRIFKEVTGENFLVGLNKIRIERSKFYLESTKMSVSAVAKKVGYSDSNYYSKQFKKFMHITPIEYRKTKGNNLDVDL